MRIRTLLVVLSLTGTALAQPTVAPTQEPVGAPRGDNVSNYNIVNSFETGYRFRTFGGSFATPCSATSIDRIALVSADSAFDCRAT